MFSTFFLLLSNRGGWTSSPSRPHKTWSQALEPRWCSLPPGFTQGKPPPLTSVKASKWSKRKPSIFKLWSFSLSIGLIEYLVGNSRDAKVLRDNIIFKIGKSTRNKLLIYGLINNFHLFSADAESWWSIFGKLQVHHYSPDTMHANPLDIPLRCSLMGFDLNRHWHDPSPWAHPTVHATKQLVMQYNRDPVSNTE